MKALLYILAITLGLSAWARQIVDPDLGWHLLGGEWIVAHKHVPTNDFINSFNATWRDYHWLAQIILFKVYNLGGFPLLRVFHGAVSVFILLSVADIVLTLLKRRPSPIVSILTIVFSWSILFRVSSPRPQIIGLLLIALVLRELIRKPRGSELLRIALHTIILVNIHVYWCFVPLLWFCYRVVPTILRGRYSKAYALIGFVLLSSLGFVSPYGYQNYSLLWEYFWMPNELKNLIVEFQPSLMRGGNLTVSIPLFGLLMILSFNRKRILINIGHWLAAIIAIVLAISSVKYAGLLAVLGTPFLSKNLASLLRRKVKIRHLRETPIALGVSLFILLPTLVLVIVFFPYFRRNQGEPKLYSLFPIEACKSIVNQNYEPKHQNHIRVMTQFDHGGWCRWAMYQERPDIDSRVTCDGRTQDASLHNILTTFELYSGKTGPTNVLSTWNPDAIVVSRKSGLNAALEPVLQTDWKSIYEDDNFRVVMRNN